MMYDICVEFESEWVQWELLFSTYFYWLISLSLAQDSPKKMTQFWFTILFSIRNGPEFAFELFSVIMT